MLRYLLSRDSYVCIADGYAVFLNLQRNEYKALTPADAQALSMVVEGWPVRSAAAADNAPNTELAAELARGGLLTSNDVAGKSAVPVSVTPVIRMLGSGPLSDVTWRERLSVVAAWGGATTMLRCLPLRVIVRHIGYRKARRRTTDALDTQLARRLTWAYVILQPKFFSRVDNCLRDSLTFVEFLALFGLYPDWIFGVRMNPFVAHCWVQQGNLVLNDSVDYVHEFTPIMAV